jgi:hypothetical protein
MKHTSYKKLKSRQAGSMFVKRRCRTIFLFLPLFIAFLFSAIIDTVWSSELKIQIVDPPSGETTAITRPDQLPLSRLAQGHRNIVTAWFTGQTDRYGHGVLGDKLEASRLAVETAEGERIDVVLPVNRVFEDVEPRLVDVNRDKRDEIIVIETDVQRGASLAVYGFVKGQLVRIAATPFLGRPYRWLNPVGVGDFDGDGHTDIALVATPHIGGILRLYRLTGDTLSLFAEYSGVSTHRGGSTELGLGRVISATPRDRLLVPNQARRELMLLEWGDNGWQEHSRVTLPGELISSLIPVDVNRWCVQLDTGTYYEIQLTH